MNWKMIFSRDAFHLWIVLFLVVAGGSAGASSSRRMVFQQADRPAAAPRMCEIAVVDRPKQTVK